ncbi:FAD binding domain-containing protein [Actibacterium sp. D379-3]
MTAYLRPRTLSAAVAAAASGRATIAAGCTDLFPATQGQCLPGDVLDLTGIAALRGVSEAAGQIRIGALTTWAELQRTDLPPAFDGLKAAAREVGSVQIQRAGTLGGNLCNASPAADGVPCLLTLDARVELTSQAGVRVLPVSEFLTGVRRTALAPGEILTAVLIPQDAARGHSAFLKLGARRYLVISIAMVTARLVVEDGLVASAALSVGACSAQAVRLPGQEAALLGRPVAGLAGRISAGLVAPALDPIADIRADAAYRRHSATELLRRAVAGLCAQTGGVA